MQGNESWNYCGARAVRQKPVKPPMRGTHNFVSHLVIHGTELYTVTVPVRHSPSEMMGRHQHDRATP